MSARITMSVTGRQALVLALAAMCLRYELRREFAPYIGVTWDRKWGNTADFARLNGEAVENTRWIAGLRIWF